MTSLLGLLLVLLGLFIASLCVAVQKMSVNVSDGCASSHQSPPAPPSFLLLLKSHSPDSPLEERSDGDLDCDLFFFLWYSSSSDSEPWRRQPHNKSSHISPAGRGADAGGGAARTNRSRARPLPVVLLGLLGVLLRLRVVVLALVLRGARGKRGVLGDRPRPARLRKVMFPLRM